ncbi:MAG: polyprenyl synthetase family protein [Promethearchaeota archaeon]
MTNTDLQNDIAKIVEMVNNYIQIHVKFSNTKLSEASRHLFNAGGKRIRPYIMTTVFSIFNDENSLIIPIASAVEILHTFTLIHDDIMDKDEFRRGFPTVHTKWGENIAILAGDSLQSLVFLIITRSSLNSSLKIKIISDFSATLIRICEGQAMDLQFEKRNDVSVDEYLDMVSRKTGDLLALSARTGAIVAGANPDICNALSQFGMNFGIGFQIVDDILGIIGDEKFGKPIGSDLRQGKKSYVILAALSLLNSSEKNELEGLLVNNNLTEKQIERGISLIQSSGAIEKARDMANIFIQDALNNLEHLPSHDGKKRLQLLTQISLQRNY